jgi:tetratricopeptide (TPR) repeat protein
MDLKSIIQGRLDYGSEKSFVQMLKMYQHRIDNFYKGDIFLKEDAFDATTFTINIPRLITMGVERSWTNVVTLLEYLAQYAISGSISAWLVQDGKILQYVVIEPKGDKAVVQNFIKGQKLSSEAGKEKEALKALTKVIDQHDSHAQAYERRGYVNYALGKMSEALYDFSKCISYDASIPSAYYCRAKVYINTKNYDAAIADLDLTTQKAIALQPIYWKARLLKGQTHLLKQEYAEAAREFKLFTSRTFAKDDPNFGERKQAYYDLAQSLTALKEVNKALEALETAQKITGQGDKELQANIVALQRQLKEKNRQPASAK